MCCVLLLLAGICHAAPVSKTILVMGDSLSAAHNIPVQAGWAYLLDQRLAKMVPKWTVINASISGETTLSGRNRLPTLLKRYRPQVLVLELGANDGLQGLSLSALHDNLATMIDLAQRQHVRVLLLGIELPVNYGPRYRDGLRKIYADLSNSRHTALVPFMLKDVALVPSLMQNDGMHPLAKGEPKVLGTVWQQLRPLLGPLKPNKR